MADNGSIIDLKDAVIEIGTQARHPGQGIADRGGQRAFARYVMELSVQPGLQGVEGGSGFGLADLNAFIRWQPSCDLLDGIECGDPADGLVGDGGALGFVHIDELAPDLGEAGDFADIAGPIQIFESGIAVGVHPAGIFGQMIFGVLAFAVGRDLISSHCPPLVRGQWRGWRAGRCCPRDFNLRRSSRP